MKPITLVQLILVATNALNIVTNVANPLVILMLFANHAVNRVGSIQELPSAT
jgi:hypothetical protein